MGHGFQHTLMDILIRYHRMQGDNALWQVGTDHAGISTQMVVERQLAAKILVAMISVANNLNNIFGIGKLNPVGILLHKCGA